MGRLGVWDQSPPPQVCPSGEVDKSLDHDPGARLLPAEQITDLGSAVGAAGPWTLTRFGVCGSEPGV